MAAGGTDMPRTETWSSETRDYVCVFAEDGSVVLNWTNRPYTMTGRQPMVSGQMRIENEEQYKHFKRAWERQRG